MAVSTTAPPQHTEWSSAAGRRRPEPAAGVIGCPDNLAFRADPDQRTYQTVRPRAGSSRPARPASNGLIKTTGRQRHEIGELDLLVEQGRSEGLTCRDVSVGAGSVRSHRDARQPGGHARPG